MILPSELGEYQMLICLLQRNKESSLELYIYSAKTQMIYNSSFFRREKAGGDREGRNRSKGRDTWEPGARAGEGPAGGRASPARRPLAHQSPRHCGWDRALGKLPASTWLCLSTLGGGWDHFYSSASKSVFELEARFPGEF